MTNFEAYAAYYDALNADKDYASEAADIARLIECHCPGAKRLLELGCGTGLHAAALSRLGYRITGIDRSENMVARAKCRVDAGEFLVGDLAAFRIAEEFDAVISLFHVMSYQVHDDDLSAAVATAAAQLRPGGIFVFDCWFGPGVLTTPPQIRIRRAEADGIRITRIAEPTHFPNENRVDVSFDIFVQSGDQFARIQEIHPMRYLFTPEVRRLFAASGLEFVDVREWPGNAEPSLSTWTACFIGRRIP
jgi:SAM-dependent methyltransferase